MADDGAAWRGRVIDERYLVEEVLGRGGMGVVLRARHRFTGATVALKVLREELAQDLELQRRFLAEARAGNAIAHPGIVEILDAGRDTAGELYLAMELLVGESLRAPISRGALSAPEVRRIGLELADALGAAHARGFIHRDLKPENVFLVAPTGTVKLLDFGIAKVLSPDSNTIARTAAGVVMGTPAYMAPEQLKDARGVDARADLWALGVMIYEMLSGRLPFRGASFEELFVAISASDPTPISAVIAAAPPALDAFFARALARDPQHRFATTAELAAALAALPLAMAAIAGRPPPPPLSVLASGYGPPTPGLPETQMNTAPPIVAATQPPPRVAPITAPITAPIAPITAPVPLVGTAPGLTSLPGGTSPGRAEPREHSTTRRNALWIGGAVVVAIAAVVIAHVATKPRPPAIAVAEPPPPPLDAAPVVALAQPDAAAPTPPTPPPPAPPDAAVHANAPVDAGTATVPHAPPRDASLVAPPPVSPNPPAAPRTAAEICDAGCALATRCGLGYAACAKTCVGRSDVVTCMREATTCNGAASCGFLAFCSVMPGGSDSCNKVSAVQGLCSRDPTCACRAIGPLAPKHAYALALYDSCATSCAGNAACVASRCALQRQGCLSQ